MKKIGEIQPETIDRLLAEIRRSSPNIYRSIVIGAYLDERISLSRAAELLGVTRIEFQKELRRASACNVKWVFEFSFPLFVIFFQF